MKKTFLAAIVAMSMNLQARAQTVIYEIPFADMVNCELTTGDICTGFIEECKRDDNPLADQWGGSWTSTGSGIATSVTVQIQYTVNDITSIPTLLNGSANNTQTAPSPFCAGSSVLSWTVDPANYNVGGANTFLLDYSSTAAICQIDNLPTSGPNDIYMIVTVDYSPCTPPTIGIADTSDVSCNGAMDGAIDITPSGGTAPYTFDWDNDGTGDFDDPEDLTGLAPGTYTVIVKEAGGCTETWSYTVTEPGPIDVTVTQSGTTLTAAATGVSYQWIDCEGPTVVSGATSQNFTPTSNGNYAVIITDGSCSDTSACTNVTGVGIEDYEKTINVFVYPNPTQGNLTISTSENYEKAEIQLLDLQGRLVYNTTVSFVNGAAQIDLSMIEKSTYILKINNSDGQMVQRITIQ